MSLGLILPQGKKLNKGLQWFCLKGTKSFKLHTVSRSRVSKDPCVGSSWVSWPGVTVATKCPATHVAVVT